MDGLYEGFGVFTHSNGMKYEGQFHDGKVRLPHSYICIYSNTHTFMYAKMHKCMHPHIHNTLVYAYVQEYMHTYTYIHTNIYVYSFIHACMHMLISLSGG